MTFSDKFELTKSEIHEKGWGREYWVCNTEKYCGKLLYFEKGKKCSFHKHIIKEEHFHLSQGKLILRVSWQEDISKAKEFIMMPGDVFHVPTGLCHQMEALEDSQLWEFSTQHFDSDSIRIIKGD